MSLALDLIVVCIITVFVVLTAIKGFVKSILSVICFVLAFYLSMALSPLFAQGVYDGFIKGSIEKNVSSAVTSGENNIESFVNESWEKLPGYLTSIAGNFGVSKQSVCDAVIKNPNEDKDALVSSIVDKTAKPVIVPILKTLFYMVLFFIFITVLKIVSRPLIKIFKLPVIGGLNRFLGAILGLVKGVIAAAIFCICIKMIINFTQGGFLIFTKENIDGTIIFKYLSNII